MHGGVVEDEVDLGLDASEIAFDFFERLPAPLNIGEAPLEDIERGGFGLMKRGSFLRIPQIILDGKNFSLETFGGVVGASGKQMKTGNEEFGVNPLQIVERIAIGFDEEFLGLGVAIDVENLGAFAVEGFDALAIIRREEPGRGRCAYFANRRCLTGAHWRRQHSGSVC